MTDPMSLEETIALWERACGANASPSRPHLSALHWLKTLKALAEELMPGARGPVGPCRSRRRRFLMGYMAHHVMALTSWNRGKLEEARAEAEARFGLTVTEIVISPVNNQASFFVAPDGSKEGWTESDDGDAARDAFVVYLNSTRYSDGSSGIRWVEVVMPEDKPAAVCRCERSSAPDEGEGSP